MYSYGPTHVQKQDDQHEHTFSNYVRIRDVVQKTCLRRWTIGKSGERGSGISVLPARHDDDDEHVEFMEKPNKQSLLKYWKKIQREQFSLVWFLCFKGLLIIEGYLKPNSSLWKNSSGIIQPIAGRDWGVHAFPKFISPKVNVILRLEFELV